MVAVRLGFDKSRLTSDEMPPSLSTIRSRQLDHQFDKGLCMPHSEQKVVKLKLILYIEIIFIYLNYPE